MTPIFAKRGNLEDALRHLKLALDELPTRRELIPLFSDATMAIAAAGGGEQVSRMIEEHAYGTAMEPLAVGLKLKRGETPIVAKEVLDVARRKENRLAHALISDLLTRIGPQRLPLAGLAALSGA